ncbi:protein DpdE [Aliterella atlantica]|nr:protein DpdE [Aliterella atlantica]
MTLGFLVRSTDNTLGIGKLTALTALEGTVEYFYSVGRRITKTLPRPSLRKVKLQRQTRCYIYLEAEATWVIGRISHWDEDCQKYEIALPDSKTILATEAEIFIRCQLPIDDPIDILAMKGQETPYFYNRRSRLVKCLIEQRAISRGITGLLSANVELYPHQVEVVRRVLEDPIQRYLLADEVGLGKTIEAGAILRQFLLDEPQQKALILVPQYLVAQWARELEDKFYISHFAQRVELLAVEDWRKIQHQTRAFGFSILDEAHHIAAMSASTDPLQKQCFATIKQLAHQCDRLLVLSATPVLNHEQDFLTMLHLLDPINYQLDDLAGFRRRVKTRQEIGHILLAFKEGANPFVLKTKSKQLQNLFSEDTYLLNLTNKLQNCLGNQAASITERDRLVGAIRTHISDTYRLHRRMLRNSRAASEDAIFARNAIPEAKYDLDDRSAQIHELLDEWRTVAPSENYSRIFLLLFRASNTWLEIFRQVIVARLNGVAPSELTQEFGVDDVQLLTQIPKFAGEQEILQSLLKIIQTPSAKGDRLELLTTIILHHLAEVLKLQSFSQLQVSVQHRVRRPFSTDKFPKLVIFTSFTQTCTKVFQSLVEMLSQQNVARHCRVDSREIVEKNIQKFRHDPHCFLLVCDSSGEEGRNLQFVDGLIHFDLPWSPNQLEQRLGRIDRIGGKMASESWLLAGVDLPDSVQNAWYQLLKDGFGIFERSIASLQFYVDKKIIDLEKLLFQSGSYELLDIIETIRAEIEAEQVKINEQNALDEIDALEEDAARYFENLDNYDAKHQDIERATEAWLCSALGFRKNYDVNLKYVCNYEPTQRTLIPAGDLIDRFAPHAKQQGTYDRRLANRYCGVNLYRIGEGLTDTLTSYLHWDDRGKAFAMWRQDESWDTNEGGEWIGFQFDYLVEADLTKVEQVIEAANVKFNQKALKRRSDALFPPILETIFLDVHLERVEDENLLKILQRPYVGKKHQIRDYNLAKNRLSILDQFIEPSQWANVCHQARNISETLLRDRSSFIELCQQQSDRAAKKLAYRLHQQKLRLNQLSQPKSTNELKLEIALNQALLAGIRVPCLKPDSVGFIILSGRTPVQPQQEGVSDD